MFLAASAYPESASSYKKCSEMPPVTGGRACRQSKAGTLAMLSPASPAALLRGW
ncbi:hypothetical protein [Acidovorax radicis]|uniref:hypothetical protein n=1 Tax=Acidovorax radicis TaxID=758826 RepID=UPI0039AFBC11